jgi:hypothetical protein
VPNRTICLLIMQYRYQFQFQTWSYKQNEFTQLAIMFFGKVIIWISLKCRMYCNKVLALTARRKKAHWNCYYTGCPKKNVPYHILWYYIVTCNRIFNFFHFFYQCISSGYTFSKFRSHFQNKTTSILIYCIFL